jgi:hypothetical protein
MGNRWIAAGLVAVVTTGAVGCGSSSDAPLSRTEFTQQANAACRAASTTIARMPYPSRPGEFRAWGAVVKRAQQAAIDRLEGLEPPTAEKESFDQLKAGLAAANDQVDGIVAKLSAGRTDLAALGRENARQTAANSELARKLGLTGCA